MLDILDIDCACDAIVMHESGAECIVIHDDVVEDIVSTHVLSLTAFVSAASVQFVCVHVCEDVREGSIEQREMLLLDPAVRCAGNARLYMYELV